MINDCLFIGLGGCGCKLVNTLMNINDVVKGVFINSNISETETLNKFDRKLNNYFIINGQGTGRNRETSKQVLFKEKENLAKYLMCQVTNNKFNTYVLVTSLDGGFGSGTFELISKIIKNMDSNCAINIVGVIPQDKSTMVSLKNVSDSYNTILNLVHEEIINSYQLIDNNKMQNNENFDYEVMRIIYDEYTMGNGEVDAADVKLVNNTSGYKVVLELDNKYKGNIQAAINDAIQNCKFALPENIYNCTNLCCSLNSFNRKEIVDLFKIVNFFKIEYNEEKNIILIGGLRKSN